MDNDKINDLTKLFIKKFDDILSDDTYSEAVVFSVITGVAFSLLITAHEISPTTLSMCIGDDLKCLLKEENPFENRYKLTYLN